MARERARAQVRSAAKQAALMAVAGVFAVFVIGFLGFTGYLALAPHVGAVGASAIVAGVFALIALGLVLAARAEAKRARKVTGPVLPDPARVASDVSRDAQALMSRHAPALVFGAFLAGFLAKRSR